jgi:hypothetical protein
LQCSFPSTQKFSSYYDIASIFLVTFLGSAHALAKLDGKHDILDVWVNRDGSHRLWLATTCTADGGRVIALIERIKDVAKISSGTTTDKIGVVCRWAARDSFGGTTKEVTHIVGQVLQDIGMIFEALGNGARAEDLVMDNNVMSGTSSTLKSSVSLAEPVPLTSLCDSTIHHRTILRVATSVVG